jgi:acetyl esterase/lipase
MVFRIITDYDSSYDNRSDFNDFERIPEAWRQLASAFRDELGPRLEALAYGEHPRQTLDLMRPGHEAPEGLVVFLHGGWWRSFDARHFSHLAAGALARGWAVAMPSYRLAPEVSIPEIVTDAGTATTRAAEAVEGPLVLCGHSAGGHLACRLASEGPTLPDGIARRIGHVVSVSGVHDLRPLLHTRMNEEFFRLDEASAVGESPALARPRPGTRLTAWVGANEKREFRRQTALIANVWLGLGATVRREVEPERHHFDVIDSLAEPEGALTRALFAREEGEP